MKIRYAMAAVALFLMASASMSGELNVGRTAPKAPPGAPEELPPEPPADKPPQRGTAKPLPPVPPPAPTSGEATIEQLLDMADKVRAQRVELETKERERVKQFGARQAELGAQEKALLDVIKKKIDHAKARVDGLDSNPPAPSDKNLWRGGFGVTWGNSR